MQTGDVQGPINREPDDKLDPSLKQQQSSSGIRRLYVVDSNNLIVVVIDIFFISSCVHNNQQQQQQSLLSSSSSVEGSTTTTTKSNSSSDSNSSAVVIDSMATPKQQRRHHIDVDTLCLCLLVFNLYYFLFICFNLVCLPKLVLASLVYVFRDRPSLFLFLTSVLFVLLNDRLVTFRSSSSSSAHKRRRDLICLKFKHHRPRLKDSASSSLSPCSTHVSDCVTQS